MGITPTSRRHTSIPGRALATRLIGTLIAVLGVVASMLLLASPSSAAGILPPNEPANNIPPTVNVACTVPNDTSAGCTNSVLHNINYGRMLEGVAPMVLPNGYAQLSVQDQILVVSNLERGARGLNTFAGLSSTMDATAQGGANGSYDPVGPPGVAWGSNWAGDVTPLDADFNWVYNDGPGGFNIDCPWPGASGCWGHRNNLLGPYNGTMGVGVAPSVYGASYATLFEWGDNYPVVDPYWQFSFPGSVPPDVVQLSPRSAGAPATGTQVVLEGNYFSLFSGGQTPTVLFGSTPATNVHVNWDGELSANAPADPNGLASDTVPVTVVTPAGSSASTTNPSIVTFSYTAPPPPSVSALSPSSGMKTGGTQVTISGAGFAGVTGVSFGSQPAPSYTVNSSTSITATAPATANFGAVPVTVTTSMGGVSALSSRDLYSYALGPTATSVSTSSPNSTPGASVTYTAAVANSSRTATGTVTFRIGATTLCTTPALVNGSGSCSASNAPSGLDTVTATYSGDAFLAPSTGTGSLVVTPSGAFNALTPTRICDTRPGNPSHLTAPSTQCNGAGNAGSTIPAGGTKVITVAGFFGVPANATAVILNVTAISPTAPGFLTVYPTGTPQPVASNVNYTAGDVVPNLVEVTPGTNGDVSIFSSAGSDIAVDVESYISPISADGAGSGLYTPLRSPARVCDTRPGNFSDLTGVAAQCNGTNNAGTRLPVDGTISIQVTGLSGIPAGATAVVLNVTVADPSTAGFLTVFAQGGPVPFVSNVNFGAGQIIGNRVIIPLSSSGKVSIFSSAASDVVVDVSGYFSAVGGSGAEFSAEPGPVRICDSRPGNPSGLSGGAAQCDGVNNAGMITGPDQNRTIKVTGLAGVPADATAVVVNVTAVSPSAATYLTVYPGDNVPNVSDLNPNAGAVRGNLCVATVNPDGTISINNHNGNVNLVVDVMGWYA